MATNGNVEKAKDVLEEGANTVEQAAHATADKVSSAAHRAKDVASDALEQGSDALENALLCAKDVIRQHPITSVAVVAAVAYLWGRIRG
ncbi:MAG: hypothetical protein QHC78_11915 [Pigmentiphaga sp.]|uniref:hypothetical protein n=1 Tax=Pigmentiphaga sp. TaxID=1977564 RepID=UPI0029B68CA2|nr:hypothetical protein [Pigmentiphaga sp.]MDX3906384.1 hypothetical protein [Pigmentiphaga sp.]